MSTPEQDHTDSTMWTSLLHSGLASFFLRLPHVPPDEEQLIPVGTGAAIYGIPWDSTVISRSGANYGPRGYREASLQALIYNATLDIDLVDALSPVDCGDAATTLANAEKTFAEAQQDIGSILAAGAVPVTLGGDHSVTIPAVRAVAERHQNPSLVLIDPTSTRRRTSAGRLSTIGPAPKRTPVNPTATRRKRATRAERLARGPENGRSLGPAALTPGRFCDGAR